MKTLEGKVNADVRKLCDWVTAYKLTLNLQKSNFVLFHPTRRERRIIPKLYIFDSQRNGNARLQSKDYIKYLDVLLDKNLSWKFYIDTIASKISKTVGFIAKIRHFIPRCILLNISSQSLIYPYITNRLASSCQSLKTHLNKILIFQKRALRMIYFADRRDHAISFLLMRIFCPCRLYVISIFPA